MRAENGVLRTASRVTVFWAKVLRGAADECWPWTGYTEDGYGMFYWDGRMRGAHELALTFTTGEVKTPGLDTCHSCNNRICCNPQHLRFDTRASNVADMLAAGRARRGRLTDGEVIAIRERHAAGARQPDLARDYNVTSSMISHIVRGKFYAHAGGPIQKKSEV